MKTNIISVNSMFTYLIHWISFNSLHTNILLQHDFSPFGLPEVLIVPVGKLPLIFSELSLSIKKRLTLHCDYKISMTEIHWLINTNVISI